jgi:hypothetical protein
LYIKIGEQPSKKPDLSMNGRKREISHQNRAEIVRYHTEVIAGPTPSSGAFIR